MILVCGATGTTGGAVLRQLRGGQQPVRALTRSRESADRLAYEGVEAVVGDLGDPGSLNPALDGVSAVYVASPATDALAEHEGNLATAARAAGAEHIVKLSVGGSDAQSPVGFRRLHGAAEDAIKAAGLPWTMLRANGFMQNTLAWASQIPSGTIRGPVMSAHWAILDVRDIAAVAERILEAPAAHAGRTYELTGAESSSPHEQVEILSSLLELGLEPVELPIADAQARLREAGVPEQYVGWLGELWQLYADGGATAVSPDVETLAGRPAYTFRQFAEDHKSLWFSG